jgi:hypothetical protein
MLSQKFVRCNSYPNVYILRTFDSLLLLVLYVDDLLITGFNDCCSQEDFSRQVPDDGRGSATFLPWNLDQSGCIRNQTVLGQVCSRYP